MYRQVDWWNMKVHAIQNNFKQGYNLAPKENSTTGLYERGSVINNGSRVKSNDAAVSFTGNPSKVLTNLGQTIPDKIAKTGAFEKLLTFFEENTSLMQAGVALIVAGVLRPATNLAMAGKDDREDSIYAASHAISSAVIGFVVSSIVLKPFDDAFKKFKKDPEKYLKNNEEKFKKLFGVNNLGSRYLEKSANYRNLSKFSQMMFDTLIMGIPKAMLTIALIPPILKYVFHIEKKPKAPAQAAPVAQEPTKAQEPAKVQESNNTTTKSNKFMNISMKQFMGGEK